MPSFSTELLCSMMCRQGYDVLFLPPSSKDLSTEDCRRELAAHKFMAAAQKLLRTKTKANKLEIRRSAIPDKLTSGALFSPFFQTDSCLYENKMLYVVLMDEDWIYFNQKRRVGRISSNGGYLVAFWGGQELPELAAKKDFNEQELLQNPSNPPIVVGIRPMVEAHHSSDGGIERTIARLTDVHRHRSAAKPSSNVRVLVPAQ